MVAWCERTDLCDRRREHEQWLQVRDLVAAGAWGIAIEHDPGPDEGKVRRGVEEDAGAVGGVDERNGQPGRFDLAERRSEARDLGLRIGRIRTIGIRQVCHQTLRPQGAFEGRRLE